MLKLIRNFNRNIHENIRDSLSKKVTNRLPFSRHITPRAVKCMWGDSYVS